MTILRCCKYWAVPASAHDAGSLGNQLRLAGDYRRALMEIENRSRALMRSLWAQPMRSVPIAERDAWREAGGNAVLKTWAASDEYKEWRARIQHENIAAVKTAYGVAGRAGLAWGTRLAVGEAIDQARRTTKWGDDLGHAPCNRVVVQIQITKPLACKDVSSADDARLRIGADLYALGDRVDGYRHRAIGEVRNRGGNIRPARMREVAIRIGSDVRAPIWAKLHVLMHRPLPDGRITWAWAQRRFVGGRAEWEFVVSVALENDGVSVQPQASHAVGIDLGWRRRGDGIRVAYWLGSDGQEGELVIPVDVERRKGKSDDLRSIRDLKRNAIAVKLRSWLEAHRGTWLDVALAHAHQWLRIGHFVRLEKAWRDQRVDGDADVYDDLVAFLRKDRHLYAWEAHNLTKMKRQIRGRFDAFAHDICSRYGFVAIEDLDLVAIKEAEDDARIAARSIQRLAPGELLLSIKKAAPKYGCVVQELNAAFTTIDCADCGHRREIKDRRELVLECDACGMAEDQDRTAARNLMAASARLRDNDGKALDLGKSVTSVKKLGSRRTRKRVITGALAT